MSVSCPRDPVIDLVGEGFGSLLVHCTARRVSLEDRAIMILGTVSTYERHADNFDQPVLRPELESHMPAADRPTFARLEADSHKSAKLLWRTRSAFVGLASRPDRPDAVLSPTPGAARIA